MNVLANILKILIVLVSLAVIAFIIMLGAMVLFPSVKIFGIHYVSGDNKVVHNTYDISADENRAQWNSVDTFLISTDSWDVHIYSVESTKEERTKNGIDARLSRNYNGFSNNEIDEATLSEFVFETKNGVNYLSLTTTEPKGWFSKFDCVLSIYVGADTFQDKKVVIKSNSGNVTLGESITNRSTTLNFKNVDIITSGGTSYVNDVDIVDTLDIRKGSGNININKDLTCDVQVAITSGLGNVYAKNIGSESVKKSLVIDELYNCGVSFSTVYGDLLVNANTGIISGTRVTGTVAFEGINCNLKVSEIGGALFFNNTDGLLSVENAQVVIADIDGSGSIYVKNLNGKSVLETTSGSVKVENVYADVTVGTVDGGITLNNAEGAKVNFVVETTNGNTSIKNVNGSVHFNTNNNGRASFTGSYKRLLDENVIKTYSGAINIDMLNAGYGFLLKDWSTTSSVYFKLSNFEEFSLKDNSTDDTYKNGRIIGSYTGTTDTLSISSKIGALKVVHPDLILS